jgi:hypothetical protein
MTQEEGNRDTVIEDSLADGIITTVNQRR